jgi:hypothetical protein
MSTWFRQVTVLWHVYWKPELWSQQRQLLKTCLLLGNGTTNTSPWQCNNRGIPGICVFYTVRCQGSSDATMEHVTLHYTTHTHQQSNRKKKCFPCGPSRGYKQGLTAITSGGPVKRVSLELAVSRDGCQPARTWARK